MAAPLFWSVLGSITALKLLLIPSYKSTDFEVHRNWLAITYSLPIDKWYYEATSEWTLDYPPLFAWFEYGLAHIAKFFDPGMLKINNLNYSSQQTVFFQRLSVIVADFWFAFAIKECCACIQLPSRQSKKDPWIHQGFVLTVLLFGNIGLLLVDHIHFQYNGFLFGFLLLSIARMLQFRYVESAFWFAVLLNFKHIFLYLAPAYFIFLLRSHCFQRSHHDGRICWKSFSLKNFGELCLVVLGVFGISFGPFIWKGQVSQVLSRLFPFKRGLTHAYWAPNFWALYNILDKFLSIIVSRLGLSSIATKASMTGGLVQEYQHAVLPNISPLFTLICSILSCLPALIKLWKQPHQPKEFIRCLVLCAFGSFLFGWHVHEKAILLVIIPLTILSMMEWHDANTYILVTLTGHFSLFPLFFTTTETATKILLLLIHGLYAYFSLSLIYRDVKHVYMPLLNAMEKLYIATFIIIQLYTSLFHKLFGLEENYPFIPLILFSVYCAFGLITSWIKYYIHFIQKEHRIWGKYS